ncbi:hypothetical protein D8674_012391 [Pyrus ussuriensis x Pyrus communis]|uniref:Uncharacterized protein n=1 Tax=Pyrus ussuriensis x Pyrus communis TaxID=2448454 RepID=A0A5N5G1I1_9ROSA|nr:hypothetical protein D8674_012391 [Pyrus ussuriensis x Pyrus communis]
MHFPRIFSASKHHRRTQQEIIHSREQKFQNYLCIRSRKSGESVSSVLGPDLEPRTGEAIGYPNLGAPESHWKRRNCRRSASPGTTDDDLTDRRVRANQKPAEFDPNQRVKSQSVGDL